MIKFPKIPVLDLRYDEALPSGRAGPYFRYAPESTQRAHRGDFKRPREGSTKSPLHPQVSPKGILGSVGFMIFMDGITFSPVPYQIPKGVFGVRFLFWFHGRRNENFIKTI